MPSATRAQTEIAAPAWAKASAIERPIPRLPPATTTRRPVKSNAMANPSRETATSVGVARLEYQILT
jgi:hypothetical protein